ncbi:MAG TPA: diguanylate cyclase [Candidatus Baltobacteraceae bacterium]|nr:diguanylate cyclase [Candidatus Baltobacteraceae bacterium]
MEETIQGVEQYRTFHRVVTRRAQIGLERMRLLKQDNVDLIAENARLSREVESLNAELQRLQNEASIDPLTGLKNRRALDAALRVEWARMGRLEEPLAVAFVDLDHFKAVNDTWKHSAGDKLLRDLGAQLRMSLRRAGDVVGRYGGDEFVFVFPALTEREAGAYLEQVRSTITKIEYKLGGKPYNIGLSIGVAAAVPSRESTLADLITRADNAAYAAKSAGRNCVVLATDGAFAKVSTVAESSKRAASRRR